MAIGRVFFVLAAVAIALPSSAAAQVFSCGPYESLVNCTARIRLEQERMARDMQKTAERRAAVMEGIQKSRASFWATYPNKPGGSEGPGR